MSAENERRAAEALPLIELDLTDKAGRPLGKAAFLKLADGYRACKGRGVLRGHVLQAAWGAALDQVVLAYSPEALANSVTQRIDRRKLPILRIPRR